jgi:hypothetical protein
VKARGSRVQGQPSKGSETLSQKQNANKKAGGVAQVVRLMRKALSSIANTTKKKKNKKKKKKNKHPNQNNKTPHYHMTRVS